MISRLRAFVRRRNTSTASTPAPNDTAPLSILLTQRELKAYGGSEMVAIECARALAARGHHVAVYCPSPGPLTSILSPSGIAVHASPADVPFAPDIIHGQHHLPTMAALAQFPHTKGVYIWHGARPWVERAPLHPRLTRHVVVSAAMKPRLSIEAGLRDTRIAVWPNFVDPARFSRVRKASVVPRRAVLFGHGGYGEGEIRALEAACDAQGLALDKIGYAYGNPRPRPEYFLPQYDVAFAIGRCALEAMASGCAVIPVVPQLAGSLITPECFDQWAASNFSPRYFRSAEVFSPDWLGRELARIKPQEVAEVTARVRADHALERAMDRLETIYRAAIAAPLDPGDGPDFADYLGTMASEVDAMWGDLEVRKTEDGARRTEMARVRDKLAVSEARVAALTDRMLAAEGRRDGG